MDVILFLIVGVVAGYVASLLVRGQGLGIVGDLVVGVIGAFVGGYILNAFGVASYGLWGAVGMSVIGAAVFLYVVSLFAGPRQRLN